MTPIRMKMGWPWDAHGFLPVKQTTERAFPPWEILALLWFGQVERPHFDLLECTFPLFFYGQPKASEMSSLDSLICVESSVECRLLPSMLRGPCAKPLCCLDLWDAAFCFLLSIRPDRVKLCRAILSHKSRIETYKIIFTCSLGQDLFLKSAVMLKRNRMLKAKHMEQEAETMPFPSKLVVPAHCTAPSSPDFLCSLGNSSNIPQHSFSGFEK